MKRTVGHLEAAGGSIIGRPYSPSNQAYSVKNRMQIRRKQQPQYFPDDDDSELDKELQELY